MFKCKGTCFSMSAVWSTFSKVKVCCLSPLMYCDSSPFFVNWSIYDWDILHFYLHFTFYILHFPSSNSMGLAQEFVHWWLSAESVSTKSFCEGTCLCWLKWPNGLNISTLTIHVNQKHQSVVPNWIYHSIYHFVSNLAMIPSCHILILQLNFYIVYVLIPQCWIGSTKSCGVSWTQVPM